MPESTRRELEQANFIICSCEGAAEREIVELLLNRDLLCFGQDKVISDGITNYRKERDIREHFLGVDYGDMVHIIRMRDSRKDKFVLKKPYDEKCIIHNIATAPEIEMIIIAHLDKVDEYLTRYKNEMKPSDYCKRILELKEVKRKGFIRKIFEGNEEELVAAIRRYASSARECENDECLLASILKS